MRRWLGAGGGIEGSRRGGAGVEVGPERRRRLGGGGLMGWVLVGMGGCGVGV